MSKAKGWKLIFMADHTSQMRVVRFSHLKSAAIAATILLVISATTYLSSRFLAARMTRTAMAAVLSENSELKDQLVVMDGRVKNVDQRINDLFQRDDQLRLVANLPKIDQDTREVGIGGAVSPSNDLASENEAVRQLLFDLDKMERELKLQHESYALVDRQLKENADMIAHMPTIRPVKTGYISSGFGRRHDPFTGRWTHHNGIDISTPRGTPIYAAAEGKVIFAKRTPGLGKLVIIDHGYGYRTAYGHMDVILTVKGQTIERWQKIGEVGSTGRSTAPHLHYEVHVAGKPVDPSDYLFDAYAMEALSSK
ncbi:MAG: M23 family metallopeptidase [Calditrichota bacterium]